MSTSENPAGTITVTAFQLAEAISIRECRAARPANILAAGSQELFYGPPDEARITDGPYTYVLNYGVVIHAGRTEADMASVNAALAPFCRDPLAEPLRETFRVRTGSDQLEFRHDEVRIGKATPAVLRIVMLHVGQSAALDYYERVAKTLLREPDAFITALEDAGRLKPSRKTVLRYVGRTLATRTRVIDTLYVLDAPGSAWDDEYLDRLDRGMKKAFDIGIRFKSIRDQLDVAKENLDVLSGLLQHRESTRLEWVIIILIFIEVVRMFFE